LFTLLVGSAVVMSQLIVMLTTAQTVVAFEEIYQMIQVCPELEMRLDAVWQRLQRYKRDSRGMTHLDVDIACIECLESTIDYLEASAHNSGFDKQNGWLGLQRK
jgi:hypothetical protein